MAEGFSLFGSGGLFSGLGDFLTGGADTTQDSTQLSSQESSSLMDKSEISGQQKQTSEQQTSSIAEQSTKDTTQATTQAGSTAQTITQLDEASRQALTSLLTGLAGQNAPVLAALTQRATGGQQNLESIIRSSQDAAKLNFGETTGRSNELLAQLVGSKNNTISQLIQQKGQRDLATQLAGIEASTRMAADKQNIDAMTAALSGSGLQSQAAAYLGSILKGAQQTQTGTTQQTASSQATDALSSLKEGTTTVSQLSELLQNLVSRGATQNSTTGSTSSSVDTEKQGALDWIGSFFR